MIQVKEMPASEKLKLVWENFKFSENQASEFLKKHLGDQAAAELRQVWQSGIKPTTPEASVEEQYEIAYGNWIWMARAGFDFIRQNMGEDGMHIYEQAEAEALIKKNGGPATWMLGLMRAVAPQTAFKMLSQNLAYQLQWITPLNVTEQSSNRFVAEIPRCKILDYPDSEDVCLIGCQRIYQRWVEAQFKANMSFDRRGHACTCTVTPL